MCGRYCIDENTVREIEKIVWQIEERLKRELIGICAEARDIFPSQIAPVLTVDEQGVCCRLQRWGFPGYEGKQLIFNARSESALEKRMFRESVERRRIVIPAARFYEWNRNKEKNTFSRKGQPALFMAGFYDRFQDEERFVILTTTANDSMRPVHDRMPLILERDEIRPWLSKDGQAEVFLKNTPALLERQVEFEQMSLFNMQYTGDEYDTCSDM